MLNKIMMTGRITTDLTVVTEDNYSYCKFCITVDQQKQNSIDTIETDTFTCLAFDDNAKATPHKARLTTLYVINLYLFRHLAQKFLDIRQYAYKISVQSDEKSDCVSAAQSLCGVALSQ